MVHHGPAAPAAMSLCCLAQPASGWKPITTPGSGGTSVQCVRVKRGGEGEQAK